MTDAITRLNTALEGRYRIEREIGEGGMATVYLARDVKHNRNVALKVLKPELAAVVGAERFLAEIETTANLQHPHILPLYDSGEADGFLFYVMPFVEGETLRDRLDREKQLPVDEAVRIATAVANALEYAHERGVVHRDIKPGNIMMQSGQPVVGDFGIALAVGSAGGARLTETGLSVGTPYYMSPEQATGDMMVGPATDLYALGAVLYELLTGDPPYMGSTAQAVLGQIIAGDPVSATKRRRSIPPNVDAALQKALEKLPADRFTSARDFAAALADPAFRHGGGAQARAAAASPGPWRAVAVATSVVAVGSLIFAVAASRRPEPVLQVERYAVPFLAGEEPNAFNPSRYALSPDGTMLVYTIGNAAAAQGRLYLRRWDELSATPIRETVNASDPAVSPDGLELAFDQGGEVKVLTFAGGPVRTLLRGDAPEWGPDGYLYASTDSGSVRVPAVGGNPERLTTLGEQEGFHQVHDVLPDGGGALITVYSGSREPEMRGIDLRSRETVVIGPGETPRYLSSGHLVYTAVNGTVMAVRFDPDGFRMLGTPVAVMDGVNTFSLSDDGKLFYAPGTGEGGLGPTLRMAWVTRSGQATPVDPSWTFPRGVDVNIRWRLSPDGSQLAVREFGDEGYDVWVKRLDAGPHSRVTFDASEDLMPDWSPDGRQIVFLSDRGGNNDVWMRPADATRDAELVLDMEQDLAEVDWTPDGEWLILRTSTGNAPDSERDVYAFRPGVDSVALPLLRTPYREINPTVSPDGRWLAYASDETGRYEVYVRPFPDVNAARWQVSIEGGSNPRWAASGRELFFQASPDPAMMTVEVDPSGSTFSYGMPTRLFETNDDWLVSNLSGMRFDVTPDGSRFIIAEIVPAGGADPDAEEGPTTILVNNFAEELKRLVPQ